MKTKEDFKRAVERMEKEGIKVFLIKDVMKEVGYDNLRHLQHPRKVMDQLVEEGFIQETSYHHSKIYYIGFDNVLKIPFFEKPVPVSKAQVFLDNFWSDISSIISSKVNSNDFFLEVVEDKVYAKVTKRELVI